MHIIIVGGGKIGYTLAKELALDKHDVVVIEQDKELADQLAQELNAKIINGNALEKDILQEAEVDSADVLVATTKEEGANLLAALRAKELGCKRIITRVNSEEYENIFQQAGVNRIISPEHSVADQLSAIITEPDVYDLAILHKDVDVLEYGLKDKSSFIGKKYHESLTPKDTLIIAVRRQGKFFIPDSNTVFQKQDKIIIVAKKGQMKKLHKLFS